jgi:protein TonB
VRKALSGAAVAVLILAGPFCSPWAMAQAAPCKPVPMMETHTLPPYPAESKKAGEQGSVLLRVLVARNGHATRADVIRKSGFVRLDEAASIYVWRNYLWQPNKCGPSSADVRVVFKLDGSPEHAPVRTKGK